MTGENYMFVGESKGLEKLKELTKTKNDGCSVSCVETAIVYLELGDYSSAAAVCTNENDKIVNYPDLQEILFELLPVYKEEQERIAKMFNFKK